MSVIRRRKKKEEARNVLALKLKRQGQVALEDNFRFVVDKSDLKSASDKKFATVAFENKICEQNITWCCEGRAIFREAAFTCSQPQNHDTRDLKICYHNNFFILFPRSSAESKYQVNATLSVIYAEFTCTKLNDTMHSLSTQSFISQTSTILLDSFTSSPIVVQDPLHWSDNTRELLSKAFTNEQRKLRFVARRNLQRTRGWRRRAGISSIIKHVEIRQTGIDRSLWLLWKLLNFVRKVSVTPAGIQVVAK